MTEPVMAHGPWRNNAELIARSIVPLGYLKPEWYVADPTYGKGNFWTLWKPDKLMASDIDPAKSPFGQALDATNLPFPAGVFDAVVLDGPYKLNGTSTGEGPSASDESFGVHEPATWQERMQLIRDMLTEATRVVARRGIILCKCQDQTCSGKKRWQTIDFAMHGVGLGLELVDKLDMPSYRAQPEGRSQKTARSNYSTMLVFRRIK